MGGSILFSHNQYDAIARSSVEESQKINRLRKKDSLTARKSSSRFEPKKVVLELRSDLKQGCKCLRNDNLNQQQFRYSKKSIQSMNVWWKAMGGEEKVGETTSQAMPSCFSKPTTGLSNKVHLNGRSVRTALKDGAPPKFENASVAPLKRSSAQPTKTVLQLCERSARRISLNGCLDSNGTTGNRCHELQHLHPHQYNQQHQEQQQQQWQREQQKQQYDRPAYAKRFMSAQINTCLSNIPLLVHPVDDGRTPRFPVDGRTDASTQFVLPALPLGLRPPSPEPRSLLLNAPKKRRFPSPVRGADSFDFSCLNRILNPYETRRRCSPKRPVCRVLRFTDE
ncbi:hypothetical protein Q1695_001706 [Nippostrongylus brasiliensis]|nr:hypothetical protein Q1695_001706 [Nippostrongylus brasiliensis]